MNDMEIIREELLNRIIPDIHPTQKANMTSAMEQTLRLFDDYNDNSEGQCSSKVW